MGAIYQATCMTCGYADRVQVGGSMATYRFESPFPLLCPTCAVVSTTNQRSPNDPACSRCGETSVTVYGAETIGALPAETRKWIRNEPFSSSMLTLGSHQCPKCSAKTLSFRSVMRFD